MTVQHEPFRKAENFPVASWFVPAKHRPAILAFYDFARGADELADATDMAAEERLETLSALSQSWNVRQRESLPLWARPLVSQLAYHPTLHGHAADLLIAFTQDCQQTRYETWDTLIDYCMHSAAPVGRAVLDICGETDAARSASDALCIVLQLTNHVQDTKADLAERGRLYWPHEMLHHYGTTEAMLSAEQETAEVSALKEAVLTRCEALIAQSTPLLSSIRSWRLRKEIAVIYEVGIALCAQLRRNDILHQRVTLSRHDKIACVLRGILR